MSSVRYRIYQLLGLSPTSPQAEYNAAQRMQAIQIHGRQCQRCKGSGQYVLKRTLDSTCFKCNGRGLLGIGFNSRALAQLEALEETGELEGHRSRWKGAERLRAAKGDLELRRLETGIDGMYMKGEATEAPIGDWNRDLHDIDQQMLDVIRLLDTFPTPEGFARMSPTQQARFHEHFEGRMAQAHAELDRLKAVLDAYRQSHTKPDFRSHCLQLVGLLPRTPSQTHSAGY